MKFKVGDRLKATKGPRKGGFGRVKALDERGTPPEVYWRLLFKWEDDGETSHCSLNSFIRYYAPILVDEDGDPYKPPAEWVDMWDTGADSGDTND